MKVITHKDITNLKISPVLCYTWVEEMLKHKHSAILPPKISMHLDEGVFCNVMPSVIQTEGNQSRVGGVKIVNRYPDRIPALDSKLILFDADMGNILAIMDANWITTMRTGAVAAHSIMLLGREHFRNIGVIGLGNAARATILVLASMLPERHMRIRLLRYKGQEKLFMQRFSEYKNLEFEVVDRVEEVIGQSEVVVSAATYLPNDICGDEHFREGILVVPIHTLGFTNCDLFFDKVYADDYQHVCHFKNFDKFKSFAEIGDVLAGKNAGRETAAERILVYNIGISLHDVNLGIHIYNLMQNEKLSSIEFFEPKEKFWI